MRTLLIRGGLPSQRLAAATVARQLAEQHHGATMNEHHDGSITGHAANRRELFCIRRLPDGLHLPTGAEITIDLNHFPKPDCRSVVFALRRAIDHLAAHTPGYLLRWHSRQQQPEPSEQEQLRRRQRLSRHPGQRGQQRRRAA
ncbi:hypothetical protein ACPRNU_00990 [Chromobacterium vaccinii]|uniref:hypothetical protein n=1 Tax=Chromobacterium vaccinii TaxID=1108595 RepID=UPI003C706803